MPPGPDGGEEATAPPEVVSLTLAWNAPSEDAKGGPLRDLARYRIYHERVSPIDRDRAAAIEVSAERTSHTFHDLTPAIWHFAIAAVDSSGNESALSEELRADLR